MEDMNNQAGQPVSKKEKLDNLLNNRIGKGKVNIGILILIAGCVWAMYELIVSILYFFN